MFGVPPSASDSDETVEEPESLFPEEEYQQQESATSYPGDSASVAEPEDYPDVELSEQDPGAADASASSWDPAPSETGEAEHMFEAGLSDDSPFASAPNGEWATDERSYTPPTREHSSDQMDNQPNETGELVPEEVAVAEETPDKFDEISRELASMNAAFTEGLGDLVQELKEKQRNEDLFTKMHEELQVHRQGISFVLLAPVFRDLIQLYNQFDMAAAGLDEGSREHDQLTNAMETILETLDRNGVEAFEDDSSPDIDRKRHRVIGTEATSDPDLNKTIAKRTSKGFTFEGKVLSYENVITYKYTPVEKEQASTPE